MSSFSGFVTGLSRVLDRIAGFCMVSIMVLVTTNILLRSIFNKPVTGTYEIVGLLTTVMFSLALAYCAARGSHIAVGFIVERFPAGIQRVVEIIVSTIAVLFWGYAAWRMAIFAQGKGANDIVSSTIKIPLHPFIYVLAFGLLALSLVELAKIIQSFQKVKEDK